MGGGGQGEPIYISKILKGSSGKEGNRGDGQSKGPGEESFQRKTASPVCGVVSKKS